MASTHSSDDTNFIAESNNLEGNKINEEDVPNKLISLKITGSYISEPIILQVHNHDTVQEIRQAVLERPECCYRTCFSLQFEGQKLDDFAEIHSISNLINGSIIRVIEESYTTREVRNHIRRVHEFLSMSYSTLFDNPYCPPSYCGYFCQSSIDDELINNKSNKDNSTDTNDSYILESFNQLNLNSQDSLFSLRNFHINNDFKVINCIKEMRFSSWNPPPSFRKLKGDLMYIDVITLEETLLCITASVNGFYVNCSMNNEFNPNVKDESFKSNTIVGLLFMLSPNFKKNFNILQKQNIKKHPLEVIPLSISVNNWLIPHFYHTKDSFRCDEMLAGHIGYDEMMPGQLRDWNEELQSAKDLPHKTLQKRVLRDRATFKISCDFWNSAIKGSVSIVDGDVLAINSSDEEKMRMYLWNNIFFSFACESRDHFKKYGGEEASYTAASLDILGLSTYNKLDIDELHTIGTIIVDYKGVRVVGQSIIPGILQRDQSNTIIYGSIDNSKTFFLNETFQKILSKASEMLKIKNETVCDENHVVYELNSSVECKGIIGADGRYYVLDLYRTFPSDANFVSFPDSEDPLDWSIDIKSDDNYRIPTYHSHRLQSLRPELLDAFLTYKYLLFLKNMATEYSNNNENLTKDSLTEKMSSKEFDISFNCDALTKDIIWSEQHKQILKEDQSLLKEASAFLINSIITKLISDFSSLIILPCDGCSLTDILHHRGINVRYLGLIGHFTSKLSKLDHIHRIVLIEMVVRTSKKVLNYLIQSNSYSQSIGLIISRFLNCLLSSCNVNQPLTKSNEESRNSRKKNPKKIKSKSFNNMEDKIIESSSFFYRVGFTTSEIWSCVKESIKRVYGYSMNNINSLDSLCSTYNIEKVCILRRFCNKTGIQIFSRHYDFTNSKKVTFNEDDINNILPSIKIPEVFCNDGKSLFDNAQNKLQVGHINEAHEFLIESLNLFHQVYGPMHRSVADVYKAFAKLYYLVEDFSQAVSFQKKAVVVSERCLGLDHYDTIISYVHLGLYSFGSGKLNAALRLMYRARYLTILACGTLHPDLSTIDTNIGLMYYCCKDFSKAVVHLEKALSIEEHYYGSNNINTASGHHLLARSLAAAGEYRTALNHEKSAYCIYKKLYGDDFAQTKESSEFMTYLTQLAVQFQKKINEISGKSKPIAASDLNINQKSIEDFGNRKMIEMFNRSLKMNGFIELTHPIKDFISTNGKH